ncbi:MAG: hypothetical protein SVO96_04750 [Pseudomonadota bacterium]|nr:hypothetical protein [Pseudomonadota bacterium]
MSLKHMPLIALLAAPVVAQAAMVELNEAELSDVNGQASYSGVLFNYAASAAWNPSYTAPYFNVTTSPVLGGVEIDTSAGVNWEVFPSWNFSMTGKNSGNTYVSKAGSGNWDPIDLSWSNTHTFTLFH